MKLKDMKKSIIYVIFLFAITGCDKNENSIGDQSYLYGTITAENQYLATEAKGLPIKKRLLYIASSPSDSTNFLYSVTTDSLGQYNFKGLKGGKEYLVFFRDTIKGNYYSVYQTLKPSEKPQMLKANIDTKDASGVIFNVTDSLGYPIKDALIYLYRSKVVAETKNSKGSVYQLKSDGNGQALKTGLSIGEWFTYVSFEVDSTNKLEALKNFSISKNQITNNTVVLRK